MPSPSQSGGEKEAAPLAIGPAAGRSLAPAVNTVRSPAAPGALHGEKRAILRRPGALPPAGAAGLPHRRPQHQPQQPPPSQYASRASASAPTMALSNSATAAALLTMSHDRRAMSTLGQRAAVPSRAHGFAPAAPAPATDPGSAHERGPPPGPALRGVTAAPPPAPTFPGLSLAAIPTHDDLQHAGARFPEPSPAACGKRKLAEIAAAQMLAGAGQVATGPAAPTSSVGGTDAGVGVRGSAAIAAEAAALDERCWAGGGGVTTAATESNSIPASGAETDLADVVAAFGAAPPVECSAALTSGLGLQIVNPDSLVDQPGNAGMTMASSKRRLLNGQASPLTPWDGQLEALVSQVKGHDPAGQPQDSSAANIMSTTNDTVSFNYHAEPAPIIEETDDLPPPLQNPHSALQIAICAGSVSEVAQICSPITLSDPSVLAERDEAGFCPLHSAAALGLSPRFGPSSQESLEICRTLLDAGADASCGDAHGNTPAHWAARAGHGDVLGLLLRQGSARLDATNDAGETALHWAMRRQGGGAAVAGAGDNVVRILVESGARVNVFNRHFRRPLDVAAEGFTDLEEHEEEIKKPGAVMTKIDRSARRASRLNLLRYSSQCRTLVLYHKECLDHLAKTEQDWEVPDRIESIVSALQSRTNGSTDSLLQAEHEGEVDQILQPCEITLSNEFERATLELLSRIHSAEYLTFVNNLSKDLEKKRKQQLIQDTQANVEDGDCVVPKNPVTILPFTPHVQRKVMMDDATKEDRHSDTAFSVGSLKAARRAAGAVQHAVDCVLVGRNRNAFCIVRPPGHHAGINGLLAGAESCGFCLFNNVAAGAMHALSDEKHRPRCERCAIVDVDVHHGNGTEEIVRKCHDSGRLLFFSVHLYDHDKPPRKTKDDKAGFQYRFYPGTGEDDDVAHNIINVPIAPLWREQEVMKSISLASNGGVPVIEPRQTRQRSKIEAAARRVPSLPDLSKYRNEELVQTTSLGPNGGSTADAASITCSSDSSAQSSKPGPPRLSASPRYPPYYLQGVGRLAYRRAIEQRLLPALRAFNPDLIMLSTGFDAARGDVGNARHYVNGEAMGLDLESEDYAWTARKICQVADICCKGRVVSVLEGGYGTRSSPASADEPSGVPQKLDRSFLSECAIKHLQGLVDPYCAEDG